MASDKKETASSASDSPGSVPITKRPARTIDLEAEDVTVEDASDETQDKPDTNSDAAGSDESKPVVSSAEPSPPPAPEQRTKPAEIKGFVTHLAAGLVGGLVGVIGAGIALDRIPVTNDTAQLAERLSSVETRLTALPGPDNASQLREATGKLETRLTALEKKPPGERPEIKDMAGRIDKLEGALKTLRTAGAQESASGVAQSAALRGRIDEVSTALETRVGGLKEDIAAISRALETRAVSDADTNGGAASRLAERIGSFEQKIASLEQKIAESVVPAASLQAPAGNGAALALAFEGLRRAAERGRPYADHLTALKDLAPEGLDLSPYEANASAGVATKAELLTALPGVLKAARGAIVTSADATFLDRVVTNARSVVRIRRIGPAEGDSPGAVLSRMEAQMKVLSLTGVLREAKALSGPVLDAVQPWIDRANARRASEDQLDALGRQLLSGLQAKSDGKR